MVDLHSHLLPGIDDGAEDLQASMALLAAYLRQGVSDVVCTPHLPPREDSTFSQTAIRAAIDSRDRALDGLREATASLAPSVRLHAGAEVMLTSSLPGLLRLFARECCLAGSPYLLVEVPSFLSSGLHAIDPLLFRIQLEGLTPVLAHPERMSLSESDLAILTEWVGQGRLLLQVNATTLLPAETLPVERRERQRRRQAAVDLLVRAGAVHIVASDTHGPIHRPPMLEEAFQFVGAKYGQRIADRLFKENPRRIIEGGEVAEMPLLS